MENFKFFFWGDKIGQGNMLGNVLYQKQAILDYKEVNFLMVANLKFFKGVNL